MSTTTTNMGLILPSPLIDIGPEWAEQVNTAFEKLDTHNHATGSGVKVTPAGLNINASVDYQDNHSLNQKSSGLKQQGSALTGQIGSIQNVGGNLFWISPAGAAVQITQGSAIISPGSGALSVDTPASYPFNITGSDSETVQIIDTSAARVVNLPAATTAMMIILKDGNGLANANPITVNPDGTDTIDGVNAAFLIDSDNAAIGFISDGSSAWYII